MIKEEFIQGANLDSKALVAKDLLSLLLPKFVLDRMQNFFEINEEEQVFEVEDPVTILFCDIADFDDVVKKNEGGVVYLLDKIFRKFDDHCVMRGVQKIETVGKTYMAAAGLKYAESGEHKLNPTMRVLKMAKDMMDTIRDYEGLKLKIGIHVGKPVMGVIGYHKPQFSLIGDVVNTTSRHCTTGKKGRIMLSEDAFHALDGFNLISKGYKTEIVPTEMKGKGSVNVYHIYPTYTGFKDRIQNIVHRFSKTTDPDKLKEVSVLSKLIMKKRNNEAKNKFYKLVMENLVNKEKIKKVFSSAKGELEMIQFEKEEDVPIDEYSVIMPQNTGGEHLNKKATRKNQKNIGTTLGLDSPNQMYHDDSIVGIVDDKLDDEVGFNNFSLKN